MVIGTHTERGIALVMALIALLIVTSIGLSMMFMADTETSINGNYRDEQTAYYASKAGLEEVRDRMRSNAGAGITVSASLPTALPGAVSGVLYILNPTGSDVVAPWLTSNPYFDDEICREVNCSGGQVPPDSNNCSQLDLCRQSGNDLQVDSRLTKNESVGFRLVGFNAKLHVRGRQIGECELLCLLEWNE
jgi:hypothetical protein